MARRARRPIPAEDSPRQLTHNPQKLRAATEQDDFESELAVEVDHEAAGAPVGQMISRELEEQEDQADDELSLTVEAPLREPRITSDDPSEVDEKKRRAIQRALDERVRKRLHVNALPKELGKPIRAV